MEHGDDFEEDELDHTRQHVDEAHFYHRDQAARLANGKRRTKSTWRTLAGKSTSCRDRQTWV